jgi:lysophospholipase L1-like esterase
MANYGNYPMTTQRPQLHIKAFSCLFMVICFCSVFIALPLLAAESIKLLPVGDSITECWEYNSCWRYWLNKKLIDNNILNVDFVGNKNGPVSNNPDENNWDMDHEGHRSATSSDILNGGFVDSSLGNLRVWAPQFCADIAIIHLGTNDIAGGNPDMIADSFEVIIDVLREANQNVHIVICQIPHVWGGIYVNRSVPDSIIRLNELIASLKDSKTTLQSPIKTVNLNETWDAETDTKDGIHPSESGSIKVAERIFKAVESWVSADEAIMFSLKRNSLPTHKKETGLVILTQRYGLNSLFANNTCQPFFNRIYRVNGQQAKPAFTVARNPAYCGLNACGGYVVKP